MDWNTQKIYQMKNEEGDKVVFQINENGRFLVSNHRTRKNKFMRLSEARKAWKEYANLGYEKI